MYPVALPQTWRPLDCLVLSFGFSHQGYLFFNWRGLRHMPILLPRRLRGVLQSCGPSLSGENEGSYQRDCTKDTARKMCVVSTVKDRAFELFWPCLLTCLGATQRGGHKKAAPGCSNMSKARGPPKRYPLGCPQKEDTRRKQPVTNKATSLKILHSKKQQHA